MGIQPPSMVVVEGVVTLEAQVVHRMEEEEEDQASLEI
jgi:hypothetical protein